MRRIPAWSWLLVGFFFFAGLGLAAWEETSSIGIGQIWIAVAVVLTLVYFGVSGKIGERLGRSGKSEDAGAQLQRLERLRRSGDLRESEYLDQLERITSGT